MAQRNSSIRELEFLAFSALLCVMTTRISLLASMMLFAGACSKRSESVDGAASAAVNDKATEPANNAGAGDVSALLGELTQQARKYGMEQRQVPHNLNDLVAKGYLSAMPEAPPGKKFAINSKLEVYLSDR